ncbi:MAG: hypothetical protein ACJASR_001431 [Psychroserpens sp.]|jgi:hypothetical protein
MWIPKCCTTNPIDPSTKMRNHVKLYYQELLTNISGGNQQNRYSENFIISKRCHIKDRSLIAQDTAINNGIHSPNSSKELIFEYFDVTNLKFNEVGWSGSKFKVLSVISLAAATLDSKKFIATDNRPFVSILIGLKKMS